MENWQTGFKAALLRYVQRNGHPEAIEVTYWDEEITRGVFGGCETCGHGADEPYELRIYYKVSEDEFASHYYYVSDRPFGELLDELLRESNE